MCSAEYLEFVNVATGGHVSPTRRTVLANLANKRILNTERERERERREWECVHGGRVEWTGGFQEMDSEWVWKAPLPSSDFSPPPSLSVYVYGGHAKLFLFFGLFTLTACDSEGVFLFYAPFVWMLRMYFACKILVKQKMFSYTGKIFLKITKFIYTPKKKSINNFSKCIQFQTTTKSIKLLKYS